MGANVNNFKRVPKIECVKLLHALYSTKVELKQQAQIRLLFSSVFNNLFYSFDFDKRFVLI